MIHNNNILCMSMYVQHFQGTLCPYERCMVKFIFAPKTFVSNKGWSHSRVVPHQKDYNILVEFTIANKMVTNCNEGN